jgi:hypothetical protein
MRGLDQSILLALLAFSLSDDFEYLVNFIWSNWTLAYFQWRNSERHPVRFLLHELLCLLEDHQAIKSSVLSFPRSLR